jgi:peroxiredoxin
LQDQDGVRRTKADLLGARAVVFFYPKDDTPG